MNNCIGRAGGGAGNRSAQMLPIEILEDRRMLSIDALSNTSEIDVRGTPGNDAIIISLAAERPNRYVFSINGKVHSFAYAHLDMIDVYARSGDYCIQVDAVHGKLHAEFMID